MNDVSPVLLLMAAMFVLAYVILWGLSIYVAAQAARRAGRRRRRWVLLAVAAGLVPGGTVLLGAGYLAYNYRRSSAGWVLAQLAALAAVVVAAATLLAGIFAWPVLAGLAAMVGAVVAALVPVMVLGLVGPQRPAGPAAGRPEVLIQAVNLKKSYDLGRQKLRVLRGVSLSVRRGEFVAILGASGSGKSTLLHLLGVLDMPDDGHVLLDGADTRTLGAAAWDRVRSRDIGFVFQFYHLLPEFNVLENTLLPTQTGAGPLAWLGARGRARGRALEILRRVGLGERLKHRPKELSGGEQQRVAIARALVNFPKILLADEPTGNLDSKTGAEIVKLLKELNRQTEQTIVMVTHDESMATNADRVLHLRDGRLQ